MKPVAFTYHRAASVAEACALLQADPESVLMAGGQSLMPLLAMRLARPTQVIDILRLPGLDAIAVTDTQVTLGATVRQAAVEHSVIIARELPLLFRAMPWVGHPPNRRRGTVGGSIANGDATAEIGLVAVALGADVLLAGDTRWRPWASIWRWTMTGPAGRFSWRSAVRRPCPFGSTSTVCTAQGSIRPMSATPCMRNCAGWT